MPWMWFVKLSPPTAIQFGQRGKGFGFVAETYKSGGASVWFFSFVDFRRCHREFQKLLQPKEALTLISVSIVENPVDCPPTVPQ